MDRYERIATPEFTWIHLISPSISLIKKIGKEFEIPEAIEEELAIPTFRAKVDQYEKITYVVLHFPLFDERQQTSAPCELDIVLGPSFIITSVTNDQWDSIFAQFMHQCHVGEKAEHSRIINQNACLNGDTPQFMVNLLVYLYLFLFRELDHIRERLDDVEKEIFDGKERHMLEKILRVRRDILDFRRTVKPHDLTIISLTESVRVFVKPESITLFNKLEGEYNKVWNTIENYKETIEALHDTNESLLSAKSNAIMKILTMMAFMTFPLALIVSIFGMGALSTPILGIPGDFWIIIGILITALLSIIGFFKFKKWI